MILLLEQQGNEVKITEEVVKAAAANFWSTKGVRRLLFNSCYSRFTIEELLRAAAWAGDIDLVESALAR
jgi:hypothetical protein